MPRGHVLPDGQAVAVLRGEAGLTQDELAVRAGYGLRTIGKIENNQPTTSSTLAAVATVLSETLGRSVELGALLSSPNGFARDPLATGSTVMVGDNVQRLEFIGHSAQAQQFSCPPARAVLLDTLSLSHVPSTVVDLDFNYLSTGRTTSGRSLSHAGASQWIPATDGADKADAATLRVRLPQAPRAVPLVMQNQVEYCDDFGSAEQACFETQVSYPTECLTLLVHFPAELAGSRLRGLCRRHVSGPFLPAWQEPLEMADGRIAFWRIMTPKPGEIYQLAWTWRAARQPLQNNAALV